MTPPGEGARGIALEEARSVARKLVETWESASDEINRRADARAGGPSFIARINDQRQAMIDAIAAALTAAAGDALERAAKVAEQPYSDEVGAYGGRKHGDEPLAVGAKIAAAIRALASESRRGVEKEAKE